MPYFWAMGWYCTAVYTWAGYRVVCQTLPVAHEH